MMYNWFEQASFIIQWIGVIFVLHLSLWSLLKRYIPLSSYPISYTFSVILLGLISWWIRVCNLPIWIAPLPFLLILGFQYGRGEIKIPEVKSELKWDAIFLAFFFIMLLTRIRNSAILSNERFLDMGFIASIMRNPIVPPLDPQFAGGYLDIYYYFSHWIFSTLGIISHVPPTVVYTLVLPTVFGLSAVTCYAIGILIIPKFPFIPLFLLSIPRPSLIIGLFTSGSTNFTTILKNSVHIISGTGNDYPYYNFLWGIPHPQVNALAIQLLIIFFCLLLLKKWDELGIIGRRSTLILLGCTAGVLINVNSWDTFIYYPLIAGVILVFLFHIKQSITQEKPPIHILNHPDFRSLLLLGCTILLVVVPFLFQMQVKAVTGIGIVQEPSNLIPYLLVHGFYLLIFYFYIFKEMKKRPLIILIGIIPAVFGYWSVSLLLIPLCYLVVKKEHTLFDYLGVYGLLALIGTEIFYLQESMEPLSRYNTVFKLSLALWPILWITGFGFLSSYLDTRGTPDSHKPIHETITLAGVCLIFGLIFICAPVNFGSPIIGLDGKEYLEIFEPGDEKVISLLQADRTASGIIEAAGDYDYHGRISSFTGIPTIIGWPSVETQWGRNQDEVQRRVHDVETFYHDPTQTLQIMDRYNCTHFVVGNFEVFKYGNIAINPYRITPQYLGNTSKLLKKIPLVT
jgi:YYY domain-containing protein